jgi:hypothetical protein
MAKLVELRLELVHIQVSIDFIPSKLWF